MGTFHSERRGDGRYNIGGLAITGELNAVQGIANAITPGGATSAFKLLDSGQAGYRIESDIAISIGTRLLLKFNDIGSWQEIEALKQSGMDALNQVFIEESDISCLGVVVWARPGEGSRYLLGVQLQEESLHNRFHAVFSEVAASLLSPME